jgi:Copper type II ascorbate-dependent monooxygenase, C-terminal domain
VLLPSGESYLEFQIHWNNPNHDLGKLSRARYEICATSKLRPQTAGLFWLGYENAFYETLVSSKETTQRLDNLGNGRAQGSCTAKTKGRILSVMPHMHERGMHAELEVVRKDGTVQPVFSNPFSFSDERSYFRENLWLEQGDSVRTRCTWDRSPVYFGFGTDAEMCFFYTLAYPLELFKASPLEKGFVGGDLACAHAVLP